MKADVLLSELERKLGCVTQGALAARLGISLQGLTNWRKQGRLTPSQIATLVSKAQRAAVGESRRDAFSELLERLQDTFEVKTQKELASILGVTVQALHGWKNHPTGVTPLSLAKAIAKARTAAVEESQRGAIRPIAEFFPIDATESSRGIKYELFPAGKKDHPLKISLRDSLQNARGIYVFYDSRGRALYAGKARDQSLWAEMKNAFNRDRDTQKVFRVSHPERRTKFTPAHQNRNARIKIIQLRLSDLAAFFSAYEVDDGMINKLEALLVRGFANDLLNKRMEEFGLLKKG